MILSDRVNDIYQNVSLCGEGCEYQSINFETNTTNCICKIKKEIKIEAEKGNFQTYIMSAFLESNFGVIKCYNLVFSSKNKLSNIGFWIFGVMILVHIPIYIFYFKNGTNNMTNFISKEMNDKGVLITGGTSGIGLAAARMFLATGAKVVIAGRNEERGTAALHSLEASDRAFFVPSDVRLSADCDRLARNAKEILGRLDVLVNSAGIYREESYIDEGGWDTVKDNNRWLYTFLEEQQCSRILERIQIKW